MNQACNLGDKSCKPCDGGVPPLSADETKQLLAQLDTSRLQHIVAAHLSGKNNRPELVVAALCGALGCDADWVAVATQQEGLDWREFCYSFR